MVKEGAVKMINYNKLIRDRIPEIIEADGKKSEIRKLNDKEYLEKLNEKLMEELKEYYEDGSIEELADLMEVVYAIVEHKGVGIEEFEKVRLEKMEKRGGFGERLFLESVSE